MIVLDTNVVSEPMKRNGNPAVRSWLDQQAAETLYLTTTSLSELLVGIKSRVSKRKKGLGAALTNFWSFCSIAHPAVRPTSRSGVRTLGQPRPSRRPPHICGGWSNCRNRSGTWIHSGNKRHSPLSCCRRTRHQPVGRALTIEHNEFRPILKMG